MGKTLLAEYDSRFRTVMIAWPHEDTDWAPLLADARSCYADMASTIVLAGCKVLVVGPQSALANAREALAHLPQGSVRYAEVATNDTWTRDYGPLTLETEKDELTAANFQFNGWGLKFAANLDNQVTGRIFARNPGVKCCDYLETVLEGGSVESDGRGTILTTTECLLSANRNNFHSKAQAEEMLARTLGARRVLWLDHGALEGDDTDSHIDTLARLAPHDCIFYVKCYREDDPHKEALDPMEEQLSEMLTPDGQPYNLIGLPLPEPCLDPVDRHRLPATYANFLITPHAVIMPVYGQYRNDLMARQMLEMVFSPEREVLTVDCRALIRQHGSLHCATMQIPDSFLPENE